MATAYTFYMVGVKSSTSNGLYGVHDLHGLLQAVGVKGNGHVVLLGYLETEINNIGVSTLILMDLHATGAGFYVPFYRGMMAGSASALDTQVYWDFLESLEVLVDCKVAVMVQACTYEGGNAGTYGGLHQFGVVIDVDMAIDASRSGYQAGGWQGISVLDPERGLRHP